MPDPVIPRLNRILGPLKSFRSSSNLPPELPANVQSELGEVLGVYENNPSELVYFTTVGLVAPFPDGHKLIPYGTIIDVRATVEDKSKVEELQLVLTDKSEALIPIRNGERNCKDAWEVMRFLMRVSNQRGNELQS